MIEIDPADEYSRFMNGLPPRATEGPFKVFQRDRLMGTVPGFPVRSTSGIFDVRPGDFKPSQRDGETVLIASPMIGPGDFGCIEGFIAAPDLPACYSERDAFATAFDAMVAHGATRTQAIGAVIEDALSTPRKGNS